MRLPSPAVVISLIALFVAMGGTTYAALWLPANSVGTKQIRRGAVTAAKLKNGAVTSAKVKDYSLLAKDFRRGQLPAGAKGMTGPQGATGPQGPPGPTSAAFAFANPASPPVPALFQGTSVTTTITTTATSRLLVFGSVGGAYVQCGTSPGPCDLTFQLYVDDQPLNGSAVSLVSDVINSAGVATPVEGSINTEGLTDRLAPGTHTLTLGWQYGGDSDMGRDWDATSQAKLAAIAVGG